MADLFSIGGALLGGLLGGNNSSTNTTADKTPWAPVQPWLQSNINSGQALQQYYQNNPFSQAQQAAYTNQFKQGADVRSTLPGIFNQMSSNAMFDRSNPTKAVNPLNFGLNTSLGTVSQGAQAPTALVDPAALFTNPYTNGLIQSAAANAAPTGVTALDTTPMRGGGHTSADPTASQGSNINATGQDSMLSNGLSILSGKLANWLSPLPPRDAPAPVEDKSTYSPAAQAEAAAAMRGFESGADRNSSPSASPGAVNGGESGGWGSRDAGGGSWKGGLVTANKLSGPNPDTPDDGYGALQKGEYVIKKDAVQKYGKGLLAEINSKRFQKRG